MVGFVCKHCNYRFESKQEHAKRPCPYCGEVEVAKEPSAEELLMEED